MSASSNRDNIAVYNKAAQASHGLRFSVSALRCSPL